MSIKALRRLRRAWLPVGKKSLLIVLLVLFAFTLWTVVAFGKATKTEKPTQVQKTEQNVEPQFPKVAPPPVEVQEVLKRGTAADFEKAVQAKTGKLPADLQQMQAQPTQIPEANATEAMPVYCIVGNQQAPCCYYKPGYEPYLSCWGQVRYATLLDIDNNYLAGCAFPYYPFDVDTVMTQIYAGDACSLWVKARVYSSQFIGPDCRFLNAVVGISDSFYVRNLGGFLTIRIPITTNPACVYGPFFAMVYIKNTDDFYFPGSDPFCSGAPFQFGLSWIYDLSGRECQSYWGSLTYTNGYLYDVVPNDIVGGAIRVRAIGHTAETAGLPDNACLPPANEWYYKDSLALAPGGVPDFDQAQMPPAFDGPTAGADILWWQFAKEGLTMPASPVALINEVAAASGTVPGVGTICDSLEKGVLNVAKAHGGWWLRETTVYAPDFVYIQGKLREETDEAKHHTMILFLGFWQEDPPGNWYRFGGHFVALSGVDIFAPTYQFAFSDPAIDNAEVGGPGVVKHAPADPWPHVGNFTVHNNPADASRDWYPVAWPSPSPGGYLYLPTYLDNWPDFLGQIAGPFPTTGTYNPTLQVYVEIEQVIDFYAGSKGIIDCILTYLAQLCQDNLGKIREFKLQFGVNIVSAIFDASFIVGPSQDKLTFNFMASNPSRIFDPLGPPIKCTFSVGGLLPIIDCKQTNISVGLKDITDLQSLIISAGFSSTDLTFKFESEKLFKTWHFILNWKFKNKIPSPITGLQSGMIFDYDIGGNADIVDFDQQHQSMWMYDIDAPDTVFGLTRVPATVGYPTITGWGLSNAARIYDEQYLDSLKYWMESLGWGTDGVSSGEDMSILMADNSFDLPEGGISTDVWLIWGYSGAIATGGDANWRHFLYRALHEQGYYRGDVNKDGKYNVADVIYMINYLFKSGPKPIDFVDQMDVDHNNQSNVADVIYSVNYLFKAGPAPIDDDRFLKASPFVDPVYKGALPARVPGLFGDPAWKTLGQ